MKKIKQFLKKEIVLTVSVILAVISMFIVKPDAGYAEYIHWSTLSILLSLMLVMSGLKELGVFKYLGRQLLKRRNHARSVMLILVGLCFFLSPFITNDVALITFVPFTIFVLEYAGLSKYIIPTLTLETIAAHMGSMISPVGNPHNLYLFELMKEADGTTAGEFILLMIPYFVAAGILLTVFIFFIARKNDPILQRPYGRDMVFTGSSVSKIIIYCLLFAVSLLPVFGVIRYYYALIIVLAVILIFDRQVLVKTDVTLIFTFIALFVLVGNLGRIQAIDDALTNIVEGNELVASVLASQVISNAPASILLSGFTDDFFALALGTDLGGLGTLIASMANLISFKKYSEMPGAKPGRYIAGFTAINVIFLVFMVAFAILF